LVRKVNQLTDWFNKYVVVQKNAHSVLIPFKLNAYYDGYWQCYHYVDDVRNILLDELLIPQKFYQKHMGLIQKMQDSESVAIHIRRGDYINIKANSMLFEVCDVNYYNLAIKEVIKGCDNPLFFIFTQDKLWARENFKGENVFFVGDNSAIDDMLLMSHCKHNIIANSTFSWWGAWLNKNPNKIIIAPKKWYKGNMNNHTINLLPKNWIRV
jgi:hypothetical protein